MITHIPIESDRLTIWIDRSSSFVHDRADEIESVWQSLCAKNPRYFNGKMLSFESYDEESNTIIARVDEYKNHAVRDTINTGISLLSVTAVLTALDTTRNQSVTLVGQRSKELHRYGGLWEFGPSGGIDVPKARNVLDLDGMLSEAAREVYEEIGVRVNSRPRGARAIIHDGFVGSSDIVIPIILEEIPTISLNWEYIQTKWLTLDELYAWSNEEPDELIPTTREHIRFLYESRDS